MKLSQMAKFEIQIIKSREVLRQKKRTPLYIGKEMKVEHLHKFIIELTVDQGSKTG